MITNEEAEHVVQNDTENHKQQIAVAGIHRPSRDTNWYSPNTRSPELNLSDHDDLELGINNKINLTVDKAQNINKVKLTL
jgi:hypothetical protein